MHCHSFVCTHWSGMPVNDGRRTESGIYDVRCTLKNFLYVFKSPSGAVDVLCRLKLANVESDMEGSASQSCALIGV